MRIGIDFDNTIACYDDAFAQVAREIGLLPPGPAMDKTAVREAVRALKGMGEASRTIPEAIEYGEYQWQKLQGLVYGKRILSAKLFEGVREFFEAAKTIPGVELFIVSHKTELAHHDPDKTDLRVAALSFLAHHRFFEEPLTPQGGAAETPGGMGVSSPPCLGLPKHHIFFEPTREEKIARIRALACDVFIDDLPEVLLDDAFPPACKRVLFSPTPQGGLTTVSSWHMLKSLILC